MLLEIPVWSRGMGHEWPEVKRQNKYNGEYKVCWSRVLHNWKKKKCESWKSLEGCISNCEQFSIRWGKKDLYLSKLCIYILFASQPVLLLYLQTDNKIKLKKYYSNVLKNMKILCFEIGLSCTVDFFCCRRLRLEEGKEWSFSFFLSFLQVKSLLQENK